MAQADYLFENAHPGGTYSSLIPSVESREQLFGFCAGLGIENLVEPDDYHCTLVYSKTPCPDIADENFSLPIAAMMKGFKILGNDTKVLVIELFCPAAKQLHTLFRSKHKAHHDYESYIPHITVATDFTGKLPTAVFDNDIQFTGFTVEELS